MHLDLCLCDRPALRDVDDDLRDQIAQVESAIEAVGECGQVVVGIFPVLQRVKRTSERCFEVAENGVDPVELGQIARLKGTHDHRNMDAPRVGDCCEAAQAIAGHNGARRQGGLGPLADGLRGEAADQAELEVKRTAFVIERDRGHKRHLVLGSTADLAARPLTAQVGVVKLDCAAQAMAFVLLGHGPVDLVVQQPSRGVAHPDLALECQGRKPGLGLTDEVDRKKPGRQRQLGVLQQTACGQRSLVAACIALEKLSCAMSDDAVDRGVASRAPKATRPARLPDSLGALRLRAEDAQELGDRHALLELDLVEVHGEHSVMRELKITVPLAHGVSHAEACFQSGNGNLRKEFIR